MINKLENIEQSELKELSKKAKERIDNEYSWDLIVRKYEELWNE